MAAVDDRALYSKYHHRLYLAVTVILVASAAGMLVAAVSWSDASPGGATAIAVLTLLAAGVTLRISRLRVVLREDHLELVNPIRTHRIPWSAIADIDTVVSYGWRVRIRLGENRSRTAFGLSHRSRYVHSSPGHDDLDRDAPRWLSQGFAELRQHWQQRRFRSTTP